jgi:LmbE family N-acetylglucosaminyl deacetylase
VRPATWLCLFAIFSADVSAAETFPALRQILPGDSLLIVAPHPDDESLCCGGIIDSARRIGARVSIVWVTFGDGFTWDAMVVERKLRPRAGTYKELAALRESEARAAAAVLNVESDSLYFLGYPDRGVLALLLDYYYPGTPWRSKFTGEHSVAYEDALDRGADYDGENLERDFQTVLERVQPTLVLAPSPQDTHPDHRGAGILVWRAMSSRDGLHKTRYWIVHGGHGWPKPRAHRPDLPEDVAPRGIGMQWEQFALDPAARDAKLRAVKSHRTQIKVMGRDMESYVRATELYSRTPMPPRSVCALAEPCEFESGTIIEESGL